MAVKTKDVAKNNGFNLEDFEYVLKNNPEHVTGVNDGFLGMTIDEKSVDQAVAFYKEVLEIRVKEKEQKAIEREEEKRATEEKERALASMLITSGFNFDGYKITRYSGYISGDDCITMPRDNFWGSNKVDENLCGALVKIRRQAIRELKEAAYDLGCNAVIGVDFDYLTMDPQHAAALNAAVTVYEPYVICVTANGNAVVIEKIDD